MRISRIKPSSAGALWLSIVSIVSIISACSASAELIPTAPPTLTPTDAPPTATFTPAPTLTATLTPLPPSATPEFPSPTPTTTRHNGQVSEGGGVELREGPGTAGAIARIVYEYAPLDVIGRTEDFNWAQVRFSDGFTGWLPAGRVRVVPSFEFADAPITGETNDIDGLVSDSADDLRLRDLPGTGSVVLSTLEAGAPLSIQARTSDNAWLQVRTPSGDEGWVAADFIEVQINLDSRPVVEVEQTLPGSANAEVIQEGDGLRLRAAPSLYAEIRANLASFTPLTVYGRSDDGQWLQVRTPEGTEGWVWTNYLRLQVAVDRLPITAEADPVNLVGSGSAESSVISGISANARAIVQRGLQQGNRARIFTQVGDSLTVSGYTSHMIGWGEYNLGADYGYLENVIRYYQTERAREHNSFSNPSLAADNGWTTQDVLDPAQGHHQLCQPDETPLACEYRNTRPAIALIQIGTNDAAVLPAADYRANLARIVETSIEMGVLPVLVTIPPRVGYEEAVQQINGIISSTARSYDVPLWDYHSALLSLPNNGLDPDGLHPSGAPLPYANSADFTPDMLQYGYTLRNLQMLQVLDALLRQVF